MYNIRITATAANDVPYREALLDAWFGNRRQIAVLEPVGAVTVRSGLNVLAT